MTRSIGDHSTKDALGHDVILSEPELHTHEIGPQTLFAVAASDGAWGLVLCIGGSGMHAQQAVVLQLSVSLAQAVSGGHTEYFTVQIIAQV